MASQAVRTVIEVTVAQSQFPLLYRNGRGIRLSLPLEALVYTKIFRIRTRNRIPIEQHLPALRITHDRQHRYRALFGYQDGLTQKLEPLSHALDLFDRQEPAVPLEHQTYT